MLKSIRRLKAKVCFKVAAIILVMVSAARMDGLAKPYEANDGLYSNMQAGPKRILSKSPQKEYGAFQSAPDTVELPTNQIENTSLKNSNRNVLFLSKFGDRVFVLTEDGLIFSRTTQAEGWEYLGKGMLPSSIKSFQAVSGKNLVLGVDFSIELFDANLGQDYTLSYRNKPGTTTAAFLSRDAGLIGAKGLNLFLNTRKVEKDSFLELSRDFMGASGQLNLGFTQGSWRASQPLFSDSAVVLAGLSDSSGAFALYDFQTGLLTYQRVPLAPALNAIHFIGKLDGVVAGDSGFVATTSDGGKTWRSRRIADAGTLRHLAFDNIFHGFMVGDRGGLYETHDAGVSWTKLTRNKGSGGKSYLCFPPPGYFVAVLLALLLVVPAFRRKKPIIINRGIGDNLASDKPLEESSQDILGLNLRAEALAGFMMNPATKPPLTFGVLGEWGKGKSSLLQLTRKRLDTRGFVTVWFNVWHHQSEESLLASLLESIRRSGLLSYWTLDGFAFRLRLIFRRSLGQKPVEIMLLFAGLFLFTLVAGIFENIRFGLEAILGGLAGLFGGDKVDPKWLALGNNLIQGSPLLLSLVAGMQFLKRVFVIFKTKPSHLLGYLKDKAKASDFSDKIGFRETFRREFEDVAAALADKPLVIFIDDLDRCRPEKIMEVLETINFLVSCGGCFFVVAMDKQQVTRAIVSHDQEFLERFREEGLSYQAYAQQYLEKIINIELSVPTAESGAFVNLLKGEAPNARRPPEPAAWRYRLYRNVPFLLVAVLAFFGSAYVVHGWLEDVSEATLASQAISGESKPVLDSIQILSPPEANGVRPFSQVSTLLAEHAEKTSLKLDIWDKSQAGWQFGAQTPRWTRLMAYAVFYLTLAYLLIAYLIWRERRARLAYADSQEFADALKNWGDLLQVSARTPRGAKKYLNRLRFFATLRRHWEREWQIQQSQNASLSEVAPTFLNDPDLVALACIELALQNLHAEAEDQEMSKESIRRLVTQLKSKEWEMHSVAGLLENLINRDDIEWKKLLNAFALMGAQVKIG